MRNKRGVLLAEALLAIAILAFAAVAIIQIFIASASFADINQGKTVSLAHLSTVMEHVKCTPFNQLLTVFPNATQDGPGNSYSTLVGGYTLSNEHITVTYPNTASDPLEIIVTLTWTSKTGKAHTLSMATKRTS